MDKEITGTDGDTVNLFGGPDGDTVKSLNGAGGTTKRRPSTKRLTWLTSDTPITDIEWQLETLIELSK
jgi:hypothetical protein